MKNLTSVLVSSFFLTPLTAADHVSTPSACPNVSNFVKLEESRVGAMLNLSVTNIGEKDLVLFKYWTENQNAMAKEMSDPFRPGQTKRVTVNAGAKSAYHFMVVSRSDYYRQMPPTPIRSKCGDATWKALNQLQARLCDEIGGSETCYVGPGGRDVRKE